jgi:hypothetical protein
VAAAGIALAIAVGMVSRARADDPACGDAVRAWVGRASRETGVPARAVECPTMLARIRLSPAGEAALDVEVAEPPGPAFRRAGRFRVSPMIEVADWSEVAPARRAAFDELVAWIAAHEDAVTVSRGHARIARADLEGLGPALWIAALLLIALGLACGRGARPLVQSGHVDKGPGPSSSWGAAGVFVLGAVLRFGLGAFGPLHVNGQGPAWVRAAVGDPTHLGAYGPGYREVFHALVELSGAAPDQAIFTANVVIGALGAPIGLVVARRLGLDPGRALLGAVLLAVEPVAIRIAATESYFVPIATLVLATIAALLEARAQWLHAGSSAARWRGRVAAVAIAAGGALLAAQAVRIHPAAWIPVALAAIVPWLAPIADVPARLVRPGERPALGLRRRIAIHVAIALAGSALVGSVVFATSGAWIAHVRELVTSAGPLVEGPALRDPLDATLWVGRVLLVAVFLIALSRPRNLAVAAIPFAIAMVLTRVIYGQSDLWQAGYDRMFLGLPILAMTAAIPERVAELRPRWRVALLVAAATIPIAVGWPVLQERTTEEREHAWLRRRFAALDPGCTLAHVERSDRRVVDLPDYAVPPAPPGTARGAAARARPVRSPDDLALLASPGRCLVWVHSSICTSAEARTTCEAIEHGARDAGLHLEPIARTRFPAQPSHRALPYDARHVGVSLHRVR